MQFIVPAQKEEKQYGNGPGGKPIDPIICLALNHTYCALCSEDPRFCV